MIKASVVTLNDEEYIIIDEQENSETVALEVVFSCYGQWTTLSACEHNDPQKYYSCDKVGNANEVLIKYEQGEYNNGC